MFCQKCGTDIGDAAFCPKCGTGYAKSPLDEEIVLWEGKTASIGDKAKTVLNDTLYTITNQRLIIKTGVIGKKQQEINLKDIKDYSVKQNVGERVQNVGDITVVSNDPSLGTIVMKNIKKPTDVKELLRKAVLDYKRCLGILYRD